MKQYWKDIKEKDLGKYNQTPKNPDRGDDSIFDVLEDGIKSSSSSRRDFLKIFGYGTMIAALTSCQTKVRKAMPYIINPKEVIPGKANYYASTLINGSDYCSIVVKTREGRPIKIEGNVDSPISNGATSAIVQSALLDLYDDNRYRNPIKDGKKSYWKIIDEDILSNLIKLKESNSEVALVTPTIYSPSTIKLIGEFITEYPNVKWIQYDPISYDGILNANKICFSKREFPDYKFSNANMIVSFGADFLGTWGNFLEYISHYSANRKITNDNIKMSHHIQIESELSLTGANADQRIIIKPSEEKNILFNLLQDIRKQKNLYFKTFKKSIITTDLIAKKLLKNRKKALVISGSNSETNQLLVNAINTELESYTNTISFKNSLNLFKGDYNQMVSLTQRMNNKEVKGIILYNVNPVYNYFEAEKFVKGLKQIDFSVSISTSPNETTALTKYECPDSHFLESWNDAEPKKNIFSLGQPAINHIFDSRQFQQSLLNWMRVDVKYYDYLLDFWGENFLSKQSEYKDKIQFFDNAVQKGVFEISSVGSEKLDLDIFENVIRQNYEDSKPSKIELVIYQNVTMGEGRYANNPWLQEIPDPITKVCWDNYAKISPKLATELDLEENDVIILNSKFELPVLIAPGQAYNTIAIALGYGRTNCGPIGNGVGVNVFGMLKFNKSLQYYDNVTISKTDKVYKLARTQTHHSMEGRDIVRETTLSEYKKDHAAGNKMREYHLKHETHLYAQHKYEGHHWAMAIDLSTCIGCSSCVASCQAENNIPVVGKDEVMNSREMHWMRIDRYFTGDEDNPEVVFQPLMCQHCDNAPCENVCPVAATTHSSEGLNQMTYNRCVGTKYCGNNCPYKVRRFNWFNYSNAGTIRNNLHDKGNMTSDLRRMVLNPDVTVRAQGVIEKCSLCVQRIQEGKLNAKLENRPLKDGDIQPACQQSCPANAIVFGDVNDSNSEVSGLIKNQRNYKLLEEIYTLPSVNYLTKIRNKS